MEIVQPGPSNFTDLHDVPASYIGQGSKAVNVKVAADGLMFAAGVAGSGTVTNVSVATANGFSGTVADSTTTPAITLTAGSLTPTSVNGITLSGSSTPTLAVTGTTTVSGANTGDQDLSTLVPKTTTVNGHALSANVSVSAADVGAPSGSGTSSGTNTGDQTISDATITTTDITTNNATTSKHGFLIKATAPSANTLNVVGIANTETIYANKLILDASSTPTTQAFSDAAVIGTSLVAAHADHKHAMMAAPTSVSGNAGTVTNGVYTTDTGTVTNTMLAGSIASSKLLNGAVANLSGTNTGDQTSIVGITGTIAQFNTALTDGDFTTGGGTASGTNTGDQTSIVGITGTTAQFNTALTDGDFATGGGTATGTNTGDQTISDATITTTDITTNDVSTLKHGFMSKLPGGTSTYYRADGTFATVSASAATSNPNLQTSDADQTIPTNSSIFLFRKYRLTGTARCLNSGFLVLKN